MTDFEKVISLSKEIFEWGQVLRGTKPTDVEIIHKIVDKVVLLHNELKAITLK